MTDILRGMDKPSYEKTKKEVCRMKNRIWIFWHWIKARIKEALGLKLTPFEDFMIEIGLY